MARAAVVCAALVLSAAPALPQRGSAARDTALHDPDPAPLIVPGRTVPDASAQTPGERARYYLELARDLDRRGQGVAAVSAYRNALLFDSTLAGVALRMGRILAALGDDATAVEMFATEVSRHPGDLEAAREFGLGLSRLGQHEMALRQLDRVTRRAPMNDQAWSALGLARLAAGRAAAAESALRRAVALPPARAAEHRDLAAALAAQGRVDEARAGYRRAIAADGADATAWLNLGNLEQGAGRPKEALAAFREAERRDSTLSAAIAAGARLLAAEGRTREAGDAYRRWVAASPLDLGARLESVEHFMAEGRADIALEIARDAMRRDTRSPDAHLLHGITLEQTGRTREALAALRRAESLFASPAGRQRARTLIASLRASAPDSLRGLFEADSIEHGGARPDGVDPQAPKR